MKSLLTTIAGGNYFQRAIDKQRAASHIRSRGTPLPPEKPRDVQVQPANGGVFVTWKLPLFHDNVAGWRVYLNTESNLAVQIRDKGTRQAFIPLSSGAVPATYNIMVSALTTLGRESTKVVTPGQPLPQTDNTLVPTVPPGFLTESAGGADRGLVRFSGESQYIK